nr:squalene/phytoene synthase family protein [Microbacterium endophyticum]
MYDHTSAQASAVVISAYSTSFALACRMLGPRVRSHVRAIYALVRVADEIVDGPGSEAGLSPEAERDVLDQLEAETIAAIDRGFSSNLIVHSFARTARECGIGIDQIGPFFDSMRTDITKDVHDDLSHDVYVYGSAEVVGLMCVYVFINAGGVRPIAPAPELINGARRLGAAFQDVNFLRDIEHDQSTLGRNYLAITDAASRTRALDRIDADLKAAADVVGLLPPDCRRAVSLAHDLFAELSQRLRKEGPTVRRVRIPDGRKATIAAQAWLRRGPRSGRS